MNSNKEIKSFEDLKVWQQTRELRNKIFKLTMNFPHDEKYRLKDQLIRASRSVTANIAEGYGRSHYQEYIQYCRQARGSLYEILDHLICAQDQGFINPETLVRLREDITSSVRLLNGFIGYLKKAKKNNSAQESEVNYDIDPNN